MGWFGKKKKKPEMSYSLPEMPKLPELPKIGEDLNKLPQLPSYPSDSLGEKFSQGAIKEAVSGKEDGDKEVFEADDSFLSESKERMMQKPLKYLTKEISTEKTRTLPEIKDQGFIKTRTKESEPVFVRMDKFEESLKIFDKAREKITEIEKFLVEVKSVREKEENELLEWENEIQRLKSQFEKINNNLFSKI